MWIKPGMLVWDNSANSHNNWGESPQAFCQTLPKTCFFPSPLQCRLLDTYRAYPALISTISERTDKNWCPRAYVCEKFLNFCKGVLQAPKKLTMEAVFWVGCLLSAYSSNGTILHDRNHFGCAFLYVSCDGGCAVTPRRHAFHRKHNTMFADFQK